MTVASEILEKDLNTAQYYLLANNTSRLSQRDVYKGGTVVVLTFDDSSCMMFIHGECYEVDCLYVQEYAD